MKKILIASNNANKVEEIRNIFNSFSSDYEILSPKDLNCSDEPIEDGFSFVENSHIKAKYYYDKFNIPTIADDSGICIKYFNDLPGIHSARFRFNYSVEETNERIISLLNNVKDRSAYYICSLTYLDSSGFHDFEGKLEGEIAYEIKGEYGFGYDPIFYLKEYNKNLAEFKQTEKNTLSHRYRATRKCVEYLEKK